MKKLKALALVGILTVAGTVATHAQNLIANGNFTANAAAFTNDLGYLNPQDAGNPTGITGWNLLNSQPPSMYYYYGLSGMATGLAADYHKNYWGPAQPGGRTYMFVYPGGAVASQNLTLAANTTYRLDFDVAEMNGGGVIHYAVDIKDNTQTYYNSGSVQANTTNFVHVTATFTTPATLNGTPVIELKNMDGGYTYSIDFANVTIVAGTNAYIPVFPVSAYGAVVNSAGDSGPAIRSAIQAAVSHGTYAIVTFQPGTYHLSFDSSLGNNFYTNNCINLLSANGLSLQGSNTTLIVTDPVAGGIFCMFCQNCSVSGITIDYNELPFTQGTITAINAGAYTFDVTLDAGYPQLSEARFSNPALGNWGIIIDPAKSQPTLKAGTDDWVPMTSMTLVSGSTYRFRPNDTAVVTSQIAVNDRFVYVARNNGWGVAFNNCSNCVLTNVTVHTAPGGAFNATTGSSGIQILNCSVSFPTNSGRLLTTDADGIIFANLRSGPIVANNYFEGMADDGMSVGATPVPILAVASTTAITVGGGYYTDTPIQAGDRVQIFNPATGTLRGETVATAVALVGTNYQLTLATPISGMVAGTTLANSDSVFDLSASGEGYLFSNNVVNAHRGRGVIPYSGNGTVISNTIIANSGQGIQIVNYAGPDWWIGPLATNVLIYGNTINGGGYVFSGAYAAIDITGGKTNNMPASGICMRGITIQNNTITNWSQMGIHAASVQNLNVINNQIQCSAAANSYGGNIQGMVLENGTGIMVNGGSITDPRANLHAGIHVLNTVAAGMTGFSANNPAFNLASGVTQILDDRSSGSANLIANGSFTANAAAFVTWPGYTANGANPAGITSWSDITGGGEGVNGTGTGSAVGNPFGPTSPGGRTYAFIQGGPNGLAQNLALISNATYELNYDVAARANNTVSYQVQIADNTQTYYTATGAGNNAAFGHGAAIFTTPATVNGTPSIKLMNLTSGDNTIDYANVSLVQIGNKPTSTTALSPTTPSTYGGAVTLTATVTTTNGIPTGTVTFLDGITTLGTGALGGGSGNSATAALTLTNLTATTHSITASYGGDANFVGSVSSARSQVVYQKPLTVTGVTAVNKVYDGGTNAALSGTASLVGVVSGDTVNLTGTPVAGFADKNVGTAKTVNVSGYTLGGASATNYSLTQPALSANITPASTAVALVSGLNPAGPGTNVTFTATVGAVLPGGGTPTNAVQFRTNGIAAALVNLNGSAQAAYATSVLPHGSNAVTAEYVSDGNFLASTNSMVQVVNTPPVANAFTLAAVSGLAATLQIIGGTNAPTDADGDPLTVTAVSAPTNGIAGTDGTNATYTTTNGFTGTDSFNYTVSDNYGGSATNTVTVNVAASNAGLNRMTVGLSGGNVVLTYLGVFGNNYALEQSFSLSPAVWLPVVTNPAPADGYLMFTNPPQPGNSFWRTRLVP